MTLQMLENNLKNGELSSLYLFYGEEEFLLESAVKKIKKLFGEILLGINFVQIDETNLYDTIENISMPAFGFEKKLIIIKNANLFEKKSKKFLEVNEEFLNYLQNNLKTIKQTTIIIFIANEVSKNELFNFIEENGIVCNFEKQKLVELIKRLKVISSAYFVQIEDSVLKYLIEVCGTDMQTLINEIRKQIEYVGKNGKITKREIDLLAVKNLESVIFDLTDNLGKKNTNKALEILKNLLYNKEPIQRILITLYNHFRKLYIIKLCIRQNYTNITEVLKLKTNQLFLVGKYKEQAIFFNEIELRTLLEELTNLDKNYKIGLVDINIGLEAILCCYCS